MSDQEHLPEHEGAAVDDEPVAPEVAAQVDEELDEYEAWLERRRQSRGR